MRNGMRKCSATVIYKSDIKRKTDYQIYSITVNHKGNYITLLHYEKDKTPQPYKYSNFQNMYQGVLALLNANNFYTSNYDEIGLRWYDIQWINVYDWELDKYGFKITDE